MNIENIRHIEARRWFQPTYGNTYHTVRVWMDDGEAVDSPIMYGYGEHFYHTVGDMFGMDNPYDFHGFARDSDITVSVIDVTRKRDLH